MKPKTMLWISFTCGWFAHNGLISAYQDWIGKAEYISKVQSDWINTHWLGWFAIMVIAYYIHLRQTDQVKNIDQEQK